MKDNQFGLVFDIDGVIADTEDLNARRAVSLGVQPPFAPRDCPAPPADTHDMRPARWSDPVQPRKCGPRTGTRRDNASLSPSLAGADEPPLHLCALSGTGRETEKSRPWHSRQLRYDRRFSGGDRRGL